jgi:nitronate monooxygenase
MPDISPSARVRATQFCQRYGLRIPILMAPMAGACPASLGIAVANAGGMGAIGALLTDPGGIAAWADTFRGQSNGGFQANLWIPDPPPIGDAGHEARCASSSGNGDPKLPKRPQIRRSSISRLNARRS